MTNAASDPFVIGRYNWLKDNGAPKKPSMQRGARRSSRTARLAGNARGLPQIVFKQVKGGGCHGANGLGAQLDYVLGKAAKIIDPSEEIDGETHLPTEYSRAIAERWADRWERKVATGHSSHLIASFPRGTSTEAVEAIVRDTCYDLLDQGRGRFNYVAAVHDDRDHPHAHIIVDRRNAEGEFFYLARDHEFNYDAFKDLLVEHAATHGIELVNSSRFSRGMISDPVQHERSKPALRGLAGELVAHGAAPYQHKPGARLNYYVTVKTEQGEKTLWGKELGAAMDDAAPVVGQPIRVKHEGKEAVEVKTKDGQIIQTHRNQWSVETEGQGREAENKAPGGDDGGRKTPHEHERLNTEWKRAQVIAHAQEYRDLSALLNQEFPVLAKGFLTAASLLEQGRALTPTVLDKVKGTTMPNDEEMRSESERLTQTIAQVRDDLKTVREGIDTMPPAERPAIESAYFDALRDVQEITRGQADRELLEPASGTIYDSAARGELQGLDRDELAARLDGTGINPDELAARFAVQTDNAALEAHWVEADAAAIADAKGYDMGTEAGRDQAFRDVVDTYERLQDRGLDLGAGRDDPPTGRDSGGAELLDEERIAQDFDERLQAQGRDLQPDRINEMPEDEFGRAVDAEIASMKAQGYDKAAISASSFEIEDGVRAKYAEEMAARAAGQPFDERDLVSTVEDREALIAEARDLAQRDTLSDDQQRRLVEIVDQALGREAAQALSVGNSDALRDFGGRGDQLDVAEHYLKAEQAHGADRTDALEAVAADRALYDMDKQDERSQELARQDEEFRQRARDEGLER